MTLNMPPASGPVPRSGLRRFTAILAAVAVVTVGLVLSTAPPPAEALTGETRMHDTTAIQADGCTWVYSTGFENDPENPTGAVTMHKTCEADQASGWTDEGPIWDEVPAWITTEYNGVTPPNYWAPDISFFDGQYHLYYAASLWSSNKIASMGLATSDNPGGPWTDQGEVTDINYPIDAAVVRDAAGELFVTWGSWGGTYLHALDETTGKLSTTDTSLVKIATGIENGAVLYHDGFYYLFGSKGSCCSGVNSTYFTAVGRSTSIGGPYLDKTGKDMVTGAGTTILTGSGTQVAAGGGDWYEANGSLWFVYHYYDAEKAGRETGNIRPMSFSDGWPVLGAPVGAITNSMPPTIAGATHPGETLSVDTGLWNIPDPTFSYSWSRNGVTIAGASAATYTTTAEDLDRSITVTVTATRADRDPLTVTSAARIVTLQGALGAGLDAADSVDVSAFTLGSSEVFTREVGAIRAASSGPAADEGPLLSRLAAAYALLRSDDTLLVENPVDRSWVTSSSPIFGGAGSAADNGWALFDGNLGTFVSGQTSMGSVTVTPTDDSTFAIDRLRVYPRGENLHGRLIGHRFEGSNDGGATWQVFATVTAAAPATWTTVDLPQQVSFDRVRMVDDHGGWINAAEVELLERSVDRTLLDLLLNDAASVDPVGYTDASVAELQRVRSAAEALTDPTQNEADAATERLRQALSQLTPRPVAAAPDAPVKPSIGVADKKVTVSFAAPDHHGSVLTGYVVTLTPTKQNRPPLILAASATATSASFPNVPRGSYTATVVAENAVGQSLPSAPSAMAVVSQRTPVELAVKAKAQCIGGAASVAVYALNASADRVDIRLSTPFGMQKHQGVLGGSAAYSLFSSNSKKIEKGVATITAYRYTDGVGYYSTYSAKFTGLNCR